MKMYVYMTKQSSRSEVLKSWIKDGVKYILTKEFTSRNVSSMRVRRVTSEMTFNFQ